MFPVVRDVRLQHLDGRVGGGAGAGLAFRQVGWQFERVGQETCRRRRKRE